MGVKVAHLRDRSGKSRAEVASDLGLSERHLYRLEKGIVPVSRRWVLAFAEYYGVAPEEIEDGDGVAA